MKNKKLLLSRVLALLIIVSSLISCFVISSSAEAVYQLDRSGYYFSPDVDYFNFESSLSIPLRFRSSRAYREIFIAYSNSRYVVYFRNDVNGFDDIICTVYNGAVTFSDYALSNRESRYLEIVPQGVSSSVYEFLSFNTILGSYGGTFNFSPSSLFSSPVFTVGLGFNVANYYTFSSFSVSFEDGSRVLKFDNTPVYSSSLGYLDFIPGTRWNGQINVQGTYLYFTDPVSSSVFHSLFRSVSPGTAPDDSYQIGYNDGKQVGYQEGLSKGFTEGYDGGYIVGYEDGLVDGRDETASSNLGSNLLGDTLQKPFNAVLGIQLFEMPNGTPFTIGTILASVLSILLLIVFLKMFAGG